MFLDPEVTGSIPSEEQGEIGGPLCYGVFSKDNGEDLQVLLSKTTTMSDSNKEPILARTSPKIKMFEMPPSVPVKDSNGYGTNTTTCHNWTRKENKKLMICYYKSKPNQKEFMYSI